MKKLLLLSFATVFFFSCGAPKKEKEEAAVQFTPANGNKYYGGVFKLNESEYIKTLFPHSIVDIYSYRVASQIYEGLFKFNSKTLEVENGLVDSYELDDSQTLYTFYLKKNAFFHDDACFEGGKGREVTASDIEYCFNLLSTPSRINQNFHLFDHVVKGAREFYQAKREKVEGPSKVEGIKVVNDHTIQIELERPNSMFLYNLARPGAFIFPKEAFELYGEDMRTKSVGTGPFKLASVDEDISIILRKNENYYGVDELGNELPFLDGIHMTFVKDKKIEFLKFQNNELHMMYRVPTDFLIEVLENDSYLIDRSPEMSTQYLAINNAHEVFEDINVRKAFSFAVDRKRILEFVLSGEGYKEGVNGVTPPAFKSYDIDNIDGYNYSPDSARIYLKKAGFPNGKGFPKITLDLNTEGDNYRNVAVELEKQIKLNLNVDVEIKISPISQIIDKSMSGNYQLLRLAWVADYPSPENYLWAFYSKTLPENIAEKSYPNMTRYKNAEFDQFYEKALLASSNKEAFDYFMKAEKVLMKDAPVIVLWYDEGYRILQPNVRNLVNNPIQYRDFSRVYFEQPTMANR
ncbi:ABC transporter substrate-binding protein [Sediminitomix flava]|uniref:Peptide/nickel transport system substrate-binding protein n=1 Tax=Sediminitomix flava TaxID=379075 RepID=A0A315ZNL9_SEDFL|nr:ABC transporter substrate-binding protein [Sediminitomix flava]PWJ36109.1 peptide/nickel transport system substrate-binding protein [Sediminitomix flava]